MHEPSFLKQIAARLASTNHFTRVQRVGGVPPFPATEGGIDMSLNLSSGTHGTSRRSP